MFKFIQASNHCKRVHQYTKVFFDKYQRVSSPRKRFPSDFWQVAHAFLNKCKFSILVLFMYPKLLYSTNDKATLLAEIFS